MVLRKAWANNSHFVVVVFCRLEYIQLCNLLYKGVYIHNIVNINKQFHYFSAVYFEKTPDKEWELLLY